jgi:endonuclease/exonuclease/phosphatase family metal-dependent hydrolase
MLEALNADVLLLQEVDLDKERTNNSDQLVEISSALGAQHSRFKETRLIPKEDGKYGIGIASKIPVVDWHSIDLPRSPIGKRMTFHFGDESETFYVTDHPRAALAAVLGNGYCVVNTHLSFMPIAAQLQMIRVVLWGKKIARKHDAKLIIGGDFNFVASSWLKLFGLRDTVVGDTFPAWKPEKQIDHFLVESNIKVSSEEIGKQSPLSDHRWIAIDI